MPKALNTPRPGDFFLVPMDGQVGFWIKFGQWLNGDGWRKVQHAGILLDDEGRTIEAMPGGAILGNIRRYYTGDIVWSSDLDIVGVGPDYDGPITDAERVRIVEAARRYLKVPYSFLDYLGLALARFGLRPRWLKRYIASTGHMICSQLVDQCYQDAGVQLFRDGRIPGDVTPADLYNLVAKTEDYDDRDEQPQRTA